MNARARLLVSLVVLPACCLALAGQAGAAITYKPSVSAPVGDAPRSVATGDLNGDGWPDIVTANEGSDDVSVLLGSATGGFLPASTFVAGDAPRSVAIGDLDGDGNPDLATANSGADQVAVLLGDGSGSFGAPSNHGVGFVPSAVAIGDLNDDGRPDLATANAVNASVLLATGGANFSPATDYATGNASEAIAIGDLDADGIPDLAVANRAASTISILYGTGTGTFDPAVTRPTGNSPASILISDLNRDGRLDIALADLVWAAVLIAEPDGSLPLFPSDYPAGDESAGIAVGDLDLDGASELVLANRASDDVSVLPGDGSGTFGAALNFGVGDLPRSVATADFNRDGSLDLVAANVGSDDVSVLMNAPTADPDTLSLSFGSPTPVPVTTTGPPQTVTVTNNGSAPLQVRGFTFSGTDPEDFLISADTCQEPVAPGQGCSVDVRFAPQSEGSRTANLNILANAAADPVIDLNGLAGPLPSGPTGETGTTGPTGPTGPRGPGFSTTPGFSKVDQGRIRIRDSRPIPMVQVSCPSGSCRILKSAASFNIGGRVLAAKVTFPGASFPAGSSRIISVRTPQNVVRLLGRKARVSVSVAARSSDGSRNQATLTLAVRG